MQGSDTDYGSAPSRVLHTGNTYSSSSCSEITATVPSLDVHIRVSCSSTASPSSRYVTLWMGSEKAVHAPWNVKGLMSDILASFDGRRRYHTYSAVQILTTPSSSPATIRSPSGRLTSLKRVTGDSSRSDVVAWSFGVSPANTSASV